MRLRWLPIAALLVLLLPLLLDSLDGPTPWRNWHQQLQQQRFSQQLQPLLKQLQQQHGDQPLPQHSVLRQSLQQFEQLPFVEHYWLLDQQQLVQLSSDPSVEGRHRSLLPLAINDHLNHQQIAEPQFCVHGGQRFWSAAVGNLSLLLAMPLGASDSENYQPLYQKIRWLWLGFALLAAAALAVLLGWSITKPLRQLNQQLQQVIANSQWTPLALKSWFELRSLSSTIATAANTIIDLRRQLQHLDQSTQMLYQRIHDGVLVVDGEGLIEYINPQGVQMLGVEDASELLQQPLNRLLPEGLLHNQAEHFEWTHRLPDGRRRLMRVNIEIGRQENGYRQQLFLHDISAQHQAEQQLRKQAHFDASGIYNQNGLQQKWRELSLAGADAELWIMVAVGIDRLRDINLSFGLAVTERLTHYVASSLQKLAPRGGFCGRLSRERYLIAYPLQEQQQDPNRLCQQLSRHSLLRSMPVGGKAVRFSVSCGYVRLVHTHQFSSALQRCLTALDLAQEQGLGVVQHITDQQFDRYAQQNRTLLRLHNAITKQQLLLYIHPKLRLSDGAIIGGEALVRWRDNGQWVSPADFIPLAERADIIHFIDQYMIKATCQLIVQLRGKAPGLSLAVNVSAKFFGREDFRRYIREIARQHQLRSGELEVEITEYSLLQDNDGIRQSIELLDKLGISLAIDDFGTGASNLQSLIDLPIKHLKIDKSFTEQLVLDGRGKPVVESIFAFTKPLQIAVTAEGIETEQQHQALKALGCDYAQGFLFFKPLPEAEFIRLVEHSVADSGHHAAASSSCS